MKIKFNLAKTVFSVALALVYSLAFAGDGPSISYDQSANVGGQNQKYSSSISPNDFDINAISEQLVQATLNGSFRLLNTWAASTPEPILNPESFGLPYPPFTAASLIMPKELWMLQLEQKKSQQDEAEENQQMARTPPYKIPDYWARWASQQGLLDYGYYMRIDEQCANSQVTSQLLYNNIRNGLLGSTQCAVSAYIKAYTAGAFTQNHNLLGLVPLCEVSQANSCGIIPGFNPNTTLSKVFSAWQARHRLAADNAASRAMVMHNAARQRYLALKDGKTPPQASDKTPSGVVIGIQPNAPTMAQLNAMTASMAAHQAAHPLSAEAQAGQNTADSRLKDCVVRHNMGKLTDAQFTQCMNAGLAGSIPGVVIPPLPGTPGVPPYAAASGAAK